MTFIPPRVPTELANRVEAAIGRVDAFARLHRVQDKATKAPIAFRPLPMQTKIFEAVEAGHKRIVVLKARQVAATTGAKMVLHHKAYTTPYQAMHAVVSMRDDSASMLLDDHRRWCQDLPSILQRPLKTEARSAIVYGDTRASIEAFTSRSTTGLRSFTPAAILVSEAAYAPDLEETIAQCDAAVGNGLLILESTANNPADFFARLVQGAPENGWHLITHWWHEHPVYRSPAAEIPDDFEASLTEAEKAERDRYGLDLGQLHWARSKRAALGSEHKFRREYPACFDDCFLDRAGGFFGDELLLGIDVVEHTLHGGQHGREIEAPNALDRYVMGVDVGGGVGGDYHALCVISVATRQVVYTERNNSITPAAWAHRAIQVASRYNQAIILAESNNHGHAFIQELDQCRYTAQWRNPTSGKAWITTLQSKIEMFDCLRENMQLMQILDRPTWMELRSLTIPPGKAAPEAPRGMHDDAAIACALAYRCLSDVPSSWRTHAIQSQARRVDELVASFRARRIRSNSLPF